MALSGWRENIIDLTLESDNRNEAPSSLTQARMPPKATPSLPGMSEPSRQPTNLHASSTKNPHTCMIGNGPSKGIFMPNSPIRPPNASSAASMRQTTTTRKDYVPVSMGAYNTSIVTGSSGRSEKRRRLSSSGNYRQAQDAAGETTFPLGNSYTLHALPTPVINQPANNPPTHFPNKVPSTKYMNAALKVNGVTTSLVEEVAVNGPRPLQIRQMPSNNRHNSPYPSLPTSGAAPKSPINPIRSGHIKDDKGGVMSGVPAPTSLFQFTKGPQPQTFSSKSMLQKPKPKSRLPGGFSEEEEHLLIFLKEVKKFPWKLITEEFNNDYPRREYHILQSRYTSSTNKRDRSKDPTVLNLPLRWAGEAVVDWATIHTKSSGQKEHLKMRSSPAIPRPSAIRGQDYSSGAEAASRRQRSRRAPPVNYDVRKMNEPQSEMAGFDFDDVIPPQSTHDNTPFRSASPISSDNLDSAVPTNSHVVLNEPLDMQFEAVDAEVGLSAQNLSGQLLPYLKRPLLESLQAPPRGWNWSQIPSRLWQGSLLHVDFSVEELRQVERAILKIWKTPPQSKHSTQRRHLRSVLKGLSEPRFKQLAQVVQRYLPSRDKGSVTAFLHDAQAGRISEAPRILRLSAARPRKFSSTTQTDSTMSMLRQRELGLQSRRGWRAASKPLTYPAKNRIMDTLGPSASWTGASSDINTLAWSRDGEHFAAGAVAVTDRDSMQYNRPNNLLFGNLLDATLHELAEHSIKRKRTETGANSSHAMFVSQDPELYTTVTSVAFAPSGKVMYSAGYDESICVWHLDSASSQPVLGAKLRHKAEVEIMVANHNISGTVATAAKSSNNAVKLLTINEDDPSDFAKHSFFSEKAVSRSDLRILPQALQFEPQAGELLLAGFGANAQKGDGYDITGDLCLWDIATQTPIPIYGSNKNVFDVAFNPNRRYMPLFAAGCVAGNTANRSARSVIRLYDIRNDKFTCPLEIECKAYDMNDVVWCPYDEFLISVGCTDSCVYVWDIRSPDDPLRVLSHGRPLMPLQEGIRHERIDTGVRFLSWGENATRLYSGSSDGIVKVWDVTRSEEDTFVKDLITANTGIMAGAFSPDFSKLVLGEVNGSVNVLDIGKNDYTMKDARMLRYVPYDSNNVYEDDNITNNPAKSTTVQSGVTEGNFLLDTQELQLAPMGNLPIRQVVQGPNYSGPFDQSVDAPFLREQALNFQLDMAATPGPQCSIASCRDNIIKVTSEEIGDSGRSTDRIPDQLRHHWTETDASTRIMHGKTKCTYCGRPARPSIGDDLETLILCERCSFACFRCGTSNPIAAATTTLICDTCAGVWDIGALGYEPIEQPEKIRFKLDVPPLRRFGREMLEERFDDELTSFGDDMNALTDYYHSLAIDRPESPPL
ncbi:hypothetical protein GQ44DRAFT_660074 [Phaeosphaeriaceae sp. PMI808]|nr:hypothetical protein GQ44DRAFT_660074 [Phaeosphaeriaceae sp. PMI808]